MKVKKTVTENRMEIMLEGRFDAVSAPKFETEIAGELEGITKLVIDMSRVEYISSAGLRAILYLQQTMDEVDGTLTVSHVPEIVMQIFEVTGFDDIITVE